MNKKEEGVTEEMMSGLTVVKKRLKGLPSGKLPFTSILQEPVSISFGRGVTSVAIKVLMWDIGWTSRS